MEDASLASLDATALAELVRNKQIHPVELVDAAIARAERVNPTLNAIVTAMFDEARTAAKAPLPDGPFTGVPFLVKDILAAVANVRMTSGAAYMKDFVPPFDSVLVTRYRRAGLVFIGKTSTPEFGFLPTTEPRLFGPCRNPWDTGRTTGGSSGGSSAAVAAGIVPMAHANDGGGSIRIPAACCGLFGLKPTRARVTLAPVLGDIMGGMVSEHAVTRSVRDSARLLDAVAGGAPGDPYVAPPIARPYAEEVGAPVGKLRIAMSTKSFTGSQPHADCARAVHETATLCAELGHVVLEAAPGFDTDMIVPAFMAIWAAGAGATLDGLAKMTGRSIAAADVEPLSWALAEMGRSVPASQYLLAVGYMQQISRQVAGFMKNYDVLLTPTLGEPPVPLGSFAETPDDPLAGFARASIFAPYTPIANITGQPAMSVPLAWNAQGLPIGVHFVGRFGDEATLFRLAAQLEAARPWAGRRPPVWA